MATETTKLTFVEGAAASTPAGSRTVIYAKADGLMYSKDDAGAETLMSGGATGSVATDPIWDAAGDLAVGSGANTAARLAIGATNGMALQRVSGAVAWALPPGYEFDYVEKTTATSITATATPDTVITGSAVAYDGSTVISVEFFSPTVSAGNTWTLITLFDGATNIGQWAIVFTTGVRVPVKLERRLTPTAASHTYSVRAIVDGGTGEVGAGAGGSGNYMPCFIRITKV